MDGLYFKHGMIKATTRVALFLWVMGQVISLAGCSDEEETKHQSYEALYETYATYSDHCNGHSRDTTPWTLYVDPDTPDEVVSELEADYILEKRDEQAISLDGLHDVVAGYFTQLDNTWSTIEVKSDHVKVVTDDDTTVESSFILGLVDEGRILIEYSEAELVLTDD